MELDCRHEGCRYQPGHQGQHSNEKRRAPTFQTETGEHHVIGFHCREGWYFKRQDDGSVRIFHVDGHAEGLGFPPETDADFLIDADSWASVVASVSKGGETGDRWQAILVFHMGEITSELAKRIARALT